MRTLPSAAHPVVRLLVTVGLLVPALSAAADTTGESALLPHGLTDVQDVGRTVPCPQFSHTADANSAVEALNGLGGGEHRHRLNTHWGPLRPAHIFTTNAAADLPRSPFSRFGPEGSGTRAANHVGRSALLVALQTPARRQAVGDAVQFATLATGTAQESTRGFELPPSIRTPDGNLTAPVRQGGIAAPFGHRRRPNSYTRARHTGISFRVTPGEAVRAVSDGVVVHVGWIDGLGQVIVIDHGHDVHSVYAHLLESAVEEHEALAAGATIGRAGGSTSYDTQELYFELRVDGIPQDPEAWLRQD